MSFPILYQWLQFFLKNMPFYNPIMRMIGFAVVG